MAKPRKKTEEELAEEQRQWDSLEAWAREEEARREAEASEEQS